MASEPKLLKLFKLLLGDKYKIVPVSDDEKNKANNTISNEDLDVTTDLVSDHDEEIDDDMSDGIEEEIDEDSECEKLPRYNITYNQDKDNNKTSISEEAKALFERDQQKYGITAQKEEKPLETNEQDLINEAQITYDQIIKYLSNEIEYLSSSKKAARESYIDIKKNSDKDDPYRSQMADSYNPLYIQEQIDYYNRIKQDPFYGRFKLVSQDRKTINVFVGRIAFEENGVMIVSPWSEIGKAFRQNKANFYIKGKYYSVINKYIYITKNGRIIGAKDESPK